VKIAALSTKTQINHIKIARKERKSAEKAAILKLKIKEESFSKFNLFKILQASHPRIRSLTHRVVKRHTKRKTSNLSQTNLLD